MRWVLGFDGGGTKTSCILMDGDGAILAESRSGPSNPLRVGVGETLTALHDAAQQAATIARIELKLIHALCAGLAGTGQPDVAGKMRDLLAAEFPQATVYVCTDLYLALAAAEHSSGDGAVIVLLAGTGSAAIGRGANGQVLRVGGHGPWNGDKGSAYDIGRRALQAGLAENVAAGQNSALREKILTELGVANLLEAQQRAQTAPEDVYARLFPVVAVLADSGDSAAQSILRAAAGELAALVATLMERLSLDGQEFLLARSGGMMSRSAFFDAQLATLLRTTAPKARIIALPMTPAEAAARLALQLLPALNSAKN